MKIEYNSFAAKRNFKFYRTRNKIIIFRTFHKPYFTKIMGNLYLTFHIQKKIDKNI